MVIEVALTGGPERREVMRTTLQTNRGMIQIEAFGGAQVMLTGREQRCHDPCQTGFQSVSFNIHGPGSRY